MYLVYSPKYKTFKILKILFNYQVIIFLLQFIFIFLDHVCHPSQFYNNIFFLKLKSVLT